MQIVVKQRGVEILHDYGKIPISFEVTKIYDVRFLQTQAGGVDMTKMHINAWTKNYDDDEGPTDWNSRWDLRNWGILTARHENVLVGGCTVAWNTEGLLRLEGRSDIAALWDIRVLPVYRQCGIGTRLFDAAIKFSKERLCRCLKVETQNINVPACNFYRKQGCVLGCINRFAYWDNPDEVMLDWYYMIKN